MKHTESRYSSRLRRESKALEALSSHDFIKNMVGKECAILLPFYEYTLRLYHDGRAHGMTAARMKQTMNDLSVLLPLYAKTTPGLICRAGLTESCTTS
jgi:hypothetical protein